MKAGSAGPDALGAALVEVSELAAAFLSSRLARTTVTTIAIDHDCRGDRPSDDGQGSTTTGLLGAALELPLQFALG